ncbi:MAG TPA: hypothetical protein VKU83_11955 [Puia sp.]|nr:hypothetical protein [Puia sp.]
MQDQTITSESLLPDNFFSVAFDAAARAQVKQAAVWAKVCTLCAFAGYGLELIVAIFARPDYTTETQGLRIGAFLKMGNIFGVIIASAIGVIINYFLYRFAVVTARGMDSMDIGKTNEGFNNLRVYFKIYGILLIVALSLGALVLLVAIGVGLSKR